MTDRRVETLQGLLDRVRQALGTEERGEALVEVARAAHQAELERASLYRRIQELENQLNEDEEVEQMDFTPGNTGGYAS